jgi:hypothetical protein
MLAAVFLTLTVGLAVAQQSGGPGFSWDSWTLDNGTVVTSPTFDELLTNLGQPSGKFKILARGRVIYYTGTVVAANELGIREADANGAFPDAELMLGGDMSKLPAPKERNGQDAYALWELLSGGDNPGSPTGICEFTKGRQVSLGFRTKLNFPGGGSQTYRFGLKTVTVQQAPTNP